VASIAVAGATGAVGARICEELLRRGASVCALVRDEETEAAQRLRALGAATSTVDLTQPATLALADVDCVVSTATCFPRTDEIAAVDRDGNLALVDAAEAAGAARFVFVSFKPVPFDFPLQRAKRAVEERLDASALDAVVLRPGKFMDIWFSPLCGFDVVARRATIYGDGTAPVSWIAAADVARIAAAAAVGDGPRRTTVELGGPEALSQRDVVAAYEHAADGEAWQLEELPVEELERLHEHGETETLRSLGALMLETHVGATTDPATFLDVYPTRLTTVAEFAASRLPAPARASTSARGRSPSGGG
jgi:uncharacterized protein YbjT (DUF2867 family)